MIKFFFVSNFLKNYFFFRCRHLQLSPTTTLIFFAGSYRWCFVVIGDDFIFLVVVGVVDVVVVVKRKKIDTQHKLCKTVKTKKKQHHGTNGITKISLRKRL